MTLANMRAQGVRSLWVVCELCHHEAVLNVDGDAVPVPALGPRMVCTCCGIVGAHARPNWQERGAEREPDRAAVALPVKILTQSNKTQPGKFRRTAGQGIFT